MSKGEGLAIISSGAQPHLCAPNDEPPAHLRSRQAQRVARRHPSLWSVIGLEELQTLGQSGPKAQQLWRSIFLSVCESAGGVAGDKKAGMRALRQLVIAQLSEQDRTGALGLARVVTVMTGLAEFALDTALTEVQSELAAVHGAASLRDGRAQSMWIVGMGKLGGRELNVSSDIDLVYLYAEDGETAGRADGGGVISNHEFFAKCARGLQAWIADVTEHGFVFRMDLALRPHGLSGPVVCSLAALRDYLLSHGREWERLAWMKSRVVTPKLSDVQAQPLRELVTPFVYRRYLDYPVFDALRDLHRQIRDQASRKALGRPNRAHDVKLGRGGIREIEFLVQSQQIVRGGQFPELRTRSTLKGLARLAGANLMAPDLADQLAQDYSLLRNLEHAIQYQDDAQTHELPSNDADLSWVAVHLGFRTSCELLRALDETRERVATAFDGVLGLQVGAPTCKGCNCDETMPSQVSGRGADPISADDWPATLADMLTPYATLKLRLQGLARHPWRLALKPADDTRLVQVLRLATRSLQAQKCSEAACVRLVDWLEGLLRREGYLALLVERPQALDRAIRLLGSSPSAVRYLKQYPSVVDELASEHWLAERFDAEHFVQDIQTRRAALALGGEDDEEALLNLLRRAHQAQVFRTLARDLEGLLQVEAVADDLSALADAMISLSLRWIWQAWWQSGDKRAHQAEPELVVLAYGKLGGKELGYGSDLDLVFIHGDGHERAQECYAALAKKLINWFTTKTAAGDLYEIDTALRPNGNAGLLVTHVDAFERYQCQRGGNAAWTWEHQAITRARVVCGPSAIADRVHATRVAVLQSPRDGTAFRREIVAMRARMRQAHPAAELRLDLKHGIGAMIDVEFAVQTLVLLHARSCPALLTNLGNIGLLLSAQGHGLLPPGVGTAAADAYRQFRVAQHARRLNEESLTVAATDWQTQCEAVKVLWAALDLL